MARPASGRSRRRRSATTHHEGSPVPILKARKKPAAGRGDEAASRKGADRKGAPSLPLQQLRGLNSQEGENRMGHLVPPANTGLSPANHRPATSPAKEESTRSALLQKTAHGHVADQPASKRGGNEEQRPVQQEDASPEEDSMEDPMDIFFSSHQRASQLPGASYSTKGRSGGAVEPVPATREAAAQERGISNPPQHPGAWDQAPALHRCSDQRKRELEAATAQQDARPSAWRSNEAGRLPDRLAAGAGRLDAAQPFKRPRTGSTPPDPFPSCPSPSGLQSGLCSPPVAKAQASHSKVNPKYSSPSPGFWEEAIRMCSDYEEPVLNETEAVVQEPAGASPAEGRGSSRAGPRPVGGQATPALQQPNQAQAAILSPAPVRHFDFDKELLVKSEQETGGSAGPLPEGADPCQDANGGQALQPDASLLVNDALPEHALPAAAGLALVEPSPSERNKGEAGGPAPFEQQGRQSSRSSEDSVCGTGGVLDGSGGRRKANEAGTSALAAEELEREKELSHWLPEEACAVYAMKGVTRMYEWQVKCLRSAAVLNGQNLVYSASTSAGKSLVAEVLLIRRVIDTGKKALLVLPFVSICYEKASHMEAVFEPLGFRVRSFFGSQGGSTLQEDTALAVCTIEKANSLVNKLLEDGRLGELGIVVIDEIHMVGDPGRGYLLELLMTKLRYAAGLGSSSSQRSASKSNGKSNKKGRRTDMLSPLRSPTRCPGSSGKMEGEGLQIVGMSATMPNTKAVAKWLNAELYETDFRPVPLEEYIKVGANIMRPDLTPVRTLPVKADRGGHDQDHLVELCDEVVREGHSVLVFCASRQQCESVAGKIASLLPPFAPSERALRAPASPGECTDAASVVAALKRAPGGIDKVLEHSVPQGVAYHHAGLTAEEREILERAFRNGIIRVLTATSTLAAGVNLPARRVIFRTPKVGIEALSATQYRQMCGRAGRAGIDSKGESILMCNNMQEAKRMSEIILAGCTPLKSCISEDENGMGRALLEVVASKIVQTKEDVSRYVRCTLLSVINPVETVRESAKEALRFLCHQRLVEWRSVDSIDMYLSTPLGEAAFASSLTPEQCLRVHEELLRARSEGLVLTTDLHLVYLVTPMNPIMSPDWALFYSLYLGLSAEEKRVAERVGVTEAFLARMAQSGSSARFQARPSTRASFRDSQKKPAPVPNASATIVLGDGKKPKQDSGKSLQICERFFVALILYLLVQEKSVDDVCSIFEQHRGTVQGLQEQAGAFAAMITAFCERMGWTDLHALLGKFQQRVAFGVKAEIAELTEIPFVKAGRARALCKGGLRSVQAVAEASSREIAKIIASWGRNNSVAGPDRTQLMMAGKIKAGARKIVMEKAEETKRAAFSSFRALGVIIPPELEKALAAPLITPGESPGESPAEDSPPLETGPGLLPLPTPQQQGRQQQQPQGNGAAETVARGGTLSARTPSPQHQGPQQQRHSQRQQPAGHCAPGPVVAADTASAPTPAPVHAGPGGVDGEVKPLLGGMRPESDRAAPRQLVAQGTGSPRSAHGTGRKEASQQQTANQAAIVPKAEPVVAITSSMYSSKAWHMVPAASGSHGAGSSVPTAAHQPGHSGQTGVQGQIGQAGSSSHTAQRGQTGESGYAMQPPQGAAQNPRLGQEQSMHNEPPQKKARVEGPGQPGAEVAAQVVNRYAHTHQLAAASTRVNATGQSLAARQGAAKHDGSEGPVDVDRMGGGFEAFMQLWGLQTEYAIDFHAGDQREAEGGVWAWELEGVAVCWKDSAVYYVNIKNPFPSGPKRPRHPGPPGAGGKSAWADAVRARWDRVMHRLCYGRGRAIVWHLQHWLKVLSQAFVLAPSSGRGAPKPGPGEETTLLSRFLAGEGNTGVKLVNVRGSLPSGQMQLAHGGKGPLPGGKIDLKRMAATGDAGGGAEGVVLPGLPGPWQVVDTKLLVWILDPVEGDRTLEKAVQLKLPAEAAGLASRAGRWKDQMSRAEKDGCCRHAAQARALYELLWKNLAAEGLERPLMDIETPLATVLAQMELDGVVVNVSECRRLKKLITEKLKQLQKEGREVSGDKTLALSNAGEVSVILYKKLNLPVPPGARETKGHLSTKCKFLDQLRTLHPLPNIVKEFRSLYKLSSSTFTHFITLAKEYKGSPGKGASGGEGGAEGGAGEVLEALSLDGEAGTALKLETLDFDTCSSPLLLEESEDPELETTALVLEKGGPNRHKIFGRWFQTQSSTGRIAMGEQNNLQCVEKPVTFTLEVPDKAEGTEAEQGRGGGGQGAAMKKVTCEVNPRALLVPSQKGRVMIGADYSQIEIRLMAHFSEDERLVAQLSDPKRDLFTSITSNTLGIPESKVTEKQRDGTKRLVYGILYGMGINTLAERLECSRDEAHMWRCKFLDAYPGVYMWLESTVKSCKQSGYICTLMGRRRYLDMINTGNSSDQSKAERQAVNSLPQGSAADLIKMAMLRLHSVISGRPIPPLPSVGQDATPPQAAASVPSAGEKDQSEWCTPGVLPVGVAAGASLAGGMVGLGDGRSVGEAPGADFAPGQPSIGGARTVDEAREAARFYHLAGRCRLLLQIHDELVAEADEAVTEDAARLLAWSMESVANLKVPLRVKVKVGDSWGGLKPYSLPQ